MLPTAWTIRETMQLASCTKLLPSVTPMTDVTLFYGSDVTTRSIAGDMQNNVARDVVMNLT